MPSLSLWRALSPTTQANLTRAGYTQALLCASPPLHALATLNLYAKLSHLGLWSFVQAPIHGTCRCGIEFICRDLPSLHATLHALPHMRVASLRPGPWQARERRAVASLHIKRFSDWPPHWLQAHIDAFGASLHPAYWLLPILPLFQLLRHGLAYHSYLDAPHIQRLLSAQGCVPP